jgi:2-haloacid dehalogenase
MRHYRNFNVCTSSALNYTASLFKLELGAQDKQRLLECYMELPAFDDAKQGLLRVKEAGLDAYAFSNGTNEAVESLLSRAGIREHFIDIVSVDEIGSFKPDPEVYHHFLKRSDSVESECWLISSNPFDVIGARSAGWQAAWVQRSPEMLFDPWDIQPTITLDNLVNIAEEIVPFMQGS